jgi:hypothetical protein
LPFHSTESTKEFQESYGSQILDVLLSAGISSCFAAVNRIDKQKIGFSDRRLPKGPQLKTVSLIYTAGRKPLQVIHFTEQNRKTDRQARRKKKRK